MIRIAFGSIINTNPEWIEFDCDLDEALHRVKTDHVKKLRSEFQLYTNYVHRFVVGYLYTGFDIWCLDDPDMSFSDIHAIYRSLRCKEINPEELYEPEFKYYCELLCTKPGQNGDIYLQIQKLDQGEWVDVWG